MTIKTEHQRGTGDVAALRGLAGGGVFLPGDSGYERARVPWSLTVDLRPAAVAYPDNATEVAALVRAAAAAGLRVAPLGTGHNAGPLADLSGTVLLRTPRMTLLSRTLAELMQGQALPEDVTVTVDIDPVDLS